MTPLPAAAAEPLRVLFVSAEVFPLAKTDGLADVSAALPAALQRQGIDVRLLMPGYRDALARAEQRHVVAALPSIGAGSAVRLIEARLPGSGLPIWLIDCPALYGRADGPYQDAEGRDWPDNAQRFALLGQVAAAIGLGAAGIGWQPHIVHANDWHAGLAPALLARAGDRRPASVFTIHNMAFQGQFPPALLTESGVAADLAWSEDLGFYGQASLLKAGIVHSDHCTTVSPSYAAEIQRPEFGCGLDGLMRARSGALTGILNGISDDLWDPASDPALAHPFHRRDLSGKIACKAWLQRHLGLEISADVPLIAFVSRLTEQKMADIVRDVLPDIVATGAQFALLAEGDAGIAHGIREKAAAFSGQVSVRTGYDEAEAHRLIAAADMVLAPARYEPCGLVQLYAMRYGALPIVRATGGLGDTVTDIEASPADGTGFVFSEPTATDLLHCIARACRYFREPIIWRRAQARAMARDFGWQRSARQYVSLYLTLGRAHSTPPAIASYRHVEPRVAMGA